VNAVPIAWQSTDESIRTRATKATSSSTPGNLSSSPTTASSSTSTEAQNSAQAGLSTGAKAAIGVCVPLAVIVGILLAIYILRRQKKTVQREEKYDKAELPADLERKVMQDPQEMNATTEQIAYLPYNGPPVELSAEEEKENIEGVSKLQTRTESHDYEFYFGMSYRPKLSQAPSKV
jgi:uncharacterized protein HemX